MFALILRVLRSHAYGADPWLQIEEQISIDTLEELKKTFELADVDGSGQLELDEFKKLIKVKLNISTAKVSSLLGLYEIIKVNSIDIVQCSIYIW